MPSDYPTLLFCVWYPQRDSNPRFQIENLTACH